MQRQRFYDLLQISGLTPPAAPTAYAAVGGVATGSDVDGLYLKNTVATSGVAFGTGSYGPSVFRTTFKIANTANPTTSFYYPTIHIAGSCQVVFTRGSGEGRGALWIQDPSLIAGTAVGTSGVTFTQNQTYTATMTQAGNGNTTGPVGETVTVAVQRKADGFWLTSAGAWQAGYAAAITYTNTNKTDNFHSVTLNWAGSTADFLVYTAEWDTIPVRRLQSTPVMLKGSTYDGCINAGFAGPGLCWDGSRFVCAASMWEVSTSTWPGGFFTSPDLFTWTYVTGSLQRPSAGNYIKSNGGLAWFQSKYWYVWGEYPAAGPAFLSAATSTDLLTWTPFTLPSPANSTGYGDANLIVNPTNNKLELWVPFNFQTLLWDTPDGTTWTFRGAMHTSGGYSNYGEAGIFYIGGTRYLTVDATIPSYGARSTLVYASANQDTNWTRLAPLLTQGCGSWETTQVFDTTWVTHDFADGKGLRVFGLYAGTNVSSLQDNTQSSFGLCEFIPPAPNPPRALFGHAAGRRFGQF